MKPKIHYIFLDVDGVLNHQTFYTERYNSYINKDDYWNFKDYPQREFSPESIKWLNKLTDETGAKIVVSSTWRLGRNLAEITKIFRTVGITGNIVGTTPYLEYEEYKGKSIGSVERGKEIEFWLANHGYRYFFFNEKDKAEYDEETDIGNYVIIDDDEDMLYRQRNNFVHIPQPPEHNDGLNEYYYKKSLEILMS